MFIPEPPVVSCVGQYCVVNANVWIDSGQHCLYQAWLAHLKEMGMLCALCQVANYDLLINKSLK